MELAYDVAFARMTELAAAMRESLRTRNEATTRLQFIDRLLFECLGWSRDEAELEEHEDGEYADYVLDRATRLVVVEAKKEGRWFELPAGISRVSRLAALYALGGQIEAALTQVERYSQRRGSPYAVICNGHQLVAFIGSRQDGVSPRDGRALVFGTADELEQDFPLLWETLSPLGVRSRRLTKRLGASDSTPPPKLAEQITEYPGVAKSDERELMLGTLRSLFLPKYIRGDEQEVEFLERCYSRPGAYSQLSALNKGVLRARYSQALGQELQVGLEDARTKDGLSPRLVEEVAATSADREPLVLLGDVGVGKTMFLRRLLLVEAKELARDGITLYVDFGRSGVLGDLRAFVERELKSQLLELYGVDIDASDFLRGTYHSEVRQFAKSVDGPLAETDPPEFKRREIDRLRELSSVPEEHIRRSLEHLVKLRRKQVIIVLDNIDQRGAKDQNAVFLMAEAFASRWPCTVFVTLRPETFNESRIRGTLSGYQPRAFTIQPPRVERVVLERLRYGKEHYAQHGRLPSWIGYTAQSEDLRRYIDLLLKSFRRNHKLQAVLVRLSGGNARRALELVSAFVQSPHAEGPSALDRTGEYVIPHHSLLRVALLGDRLYYEPAASKIPNLFDISTDDPREHFLAPCVLGLLRRAADTRDSEGYVAADEVFRAFQDLGFGVDQIDYAVQRLRAGDMIEALPPEAKSSSGVRAMRTTAFGLYGQTELAAEFQYLDAVLIDTPITKPAVRQKLTVVSAIRQRLARAEVFLHYLDECWAGAGFDSDGLFDWPSHSLTARHELETIHARL